MKIYLPRRTDKPEVGGGWTFTHNLIRALRDKVEFTNGLGSCDVLFIPGCTMVDKEIVREAKELGKKIVLRIDNVPRNSRNRNTSVSKLRLFSELADVIIYQSEWARKWIYPFTKKDGLVILNGADESIFKPQGDRMSNEGSPQYLYSRYNRDETKMWEMCWYNFQKIYYENPKAHLWIVGRFSDVQREYKFDLFGGAEERYAYLGMIEDQEKMAQIYRGADYLVYPYLLDACSNVLIEAIMCGTKILYIGNGDNSAHEILKADKKELTLKAMGQKYLNVFKKL